MNKKIEKSVLESVARPRPWDGLMSKEEEEVFRRAGFGTPVGFGKKPALLIIDVQYRTVGTEPRPVLEAIKEFPTSCGEAGWKAVARIEKLVEVFRRLGYPIVYPHVAMKDSYDRGQFEDKVPGVMDIPPKGYEFVQEVAPRKGDILIPKFHASAFFGTSLASYLIGRGVDSVVFAGCTTSGCVRSSVVDACSYNFKCIVSEDGVYDRSPHSHAISLFDMAYKYADVLPVDEIVRELERLHAEN